MPTPFRLVAVARDGSQQTWDAEFDHDAGASEWTYRVTTPGCQDFYEARFKEVGAEHIQPGFRSMRALRGVMS